MKRYIKSNVDFGATDDYWFRRSLSENRDTDPDYLVDLSYDEDSEIRENVAKHPNTPIEVLARLADDEDIYVRNSVAYSGRNLSREIFLKLSKEENESIRGSIAGNPYTPADILNTLSQDKSIYVRKRVADNPNTPPDTLDALVNDKNYDISRYALCNPSCPKSTISKFVEHLDSMDMADWYNREICIELACDFDTPVEVLMKLAESKDWQIGPSAKSKLKLMHIEGYE